MTDKQAACTVRQEDLVAVWKVLEALTVSLDKIEHYCLFHGEDAAKEALLTFMQPLMFDRIAHARQTLVTMLESCDPAIQARLELLASNEAEIGYWQGSGQTEG
jgi:hypothetical protein